MSNTVCSKGCAPVKRINREKDINLSCPRFPLFSNTTCEQSSWVQSLGGQVIILHGRQQKRKKCRQSFPVPVLDLTRKPQETKVLFRLELEVYMSCVFATHSLCRPRAGCSNPRRPTGLVLVAAESRSGSCPSLSHFHSFACEKVLYNNYINQPPGETTSFHRSRTKYCHFS